MTRNVVLAGCSILSLLTGCGPRHTPQVAIPDCTGGWEQTWGPDSAFSLCTPPGFKAMEPGVWSRPRPESAAVDFLAVALLQDAIAYDTPPGWPPKLAPPRDCSVDCWVADSVTVHLDSIDGHQVRTEVGLLSGGAFGMRRDPHLVTGWRGPDGSGWYAQGWAAVPATLDTLRMALRSLRLRS